MAERGGLISTQELADIIGRTDLRVFDCTTYLEYQPTGSGIPYLVVPGRHTFEAEHIPGAGFTAGRILGSKHRTALHDAGRRAAGGGVRRPWRQ